LILGLFA